MYSPTLKTLAFIAAASVGVFLPVSAHSSSVAAVDFVCLTHSILAGLIFIFDLHIYTHPFFICQVIRFEEPVCRGSGEFLPVGMCYGLNET